MNTESSNDLVSISIDTLDRVTGGNGGPVPGPGKEKDPTSQIAKDLAQLTNAVRAVGSGSSTSTGATVHNGGGNSDYYY